MLLECESTGVWCCSRMYQCTWQGFALHQGLGWGKIPSRTEAWTQFHDRHCTGILIQLIPQTKYKYNKNETE